MGLVAAVALALLGCGGCATKPSRSEVVSALGQAMNESRDAGAHAGPQFRDLPPEVIAAAANAPDEESFRRELVKLLDQLQDGHAAVEPDADHALDVASGVTVVELDGRLWIGFQDDMRGPLDVLRWTGIGSATSRDDLKVVRDWMILEEIDGYAPRHMTAACCLLEGLPGTSVEVAGIRPDGARVRRTMPRGARETSMFCSAGSVGRVAQEFAANEGFIDPVPAASRVSGRAKDSPLAWSSLVGPGSSVGYLRLPSMDSPGDCPSWRCLRGDQPCEARRAIADAIRPLMGCEVIIIDLGGNGGGLCMHGAEVLRWLLPRSFDRVPFAHLRRNGESDRWEVPPPSARFGGRLVVIADGGTCSAAEHLVNVLKGAPNTTVVGSPTGGFEFSVHSLESRYPGLKVRFGGTPTVWDPPRQSAEGRPVEPDIAVPVDPRVLEGYGPLAALVQQRMDSLAVAWRVAGLRGPEGGIVADIRSLIPWKVWPALGRLLALGGLILAALVALLVWLRARRRRARSLAAAVA